MKLLKRVALALMVCVILFSMMFIQVVAHSTLLDIEYDTCVSFKDGDGIDEMWYVLDHPNACHISQTVETIKYCFAEESIEGDCTWATAVTPNITEEAANEIKSSYAASMEKWNNVCFYNYDYSGSIIKKRVINVQQGSITDEDINLVIYPSSFDDGVIAGAAWLNRVSVEGENVEHYHAAEWIMEVCVPKFVFGVSESISDVEAIRENTGAHELGHMLGLGDIDSHCTASQANDETVDNWHHQELIMGYGLPVSDRSLNITYKDIAGVAITRGFHTDSDHKWLNAGLQADETDENYGKYKLICSICNGVKYATDLSGYTYDTFLACDSDHTMNSGNLMAVASYGDKDYYKCKYCRYVAPFSSIVSQDYVLSYHSETDHKYTNSVDGLNYSFLEGHHLVDNTCTICGYVHTHSYDTYSYVNGRSHIKSCSCGDAVIESHFVRRADIVDGRYAPCGGCKEVLDLDKDNAIIGIVSISKVTINGSYILPNGIVVLVDEDIQAFLNGTLLFTVLDDSVVE